MNIEDEKSSFSSRGSWILGGFWESKRAYIKEERGEGGGGDGKERERERGFMKREKEKRGLMLWLMMMVAAPCLLGPRVLESPEARCLATSLLVY